MKPFIFTRKKFEIPEAHLATWKAATPPPKVPEEEMWHMQA